MVFGTGKGAGKIVLVMVLFVGGYFLFNLMKKRMS